MESLKRFSDTEIPIRAWDNILVKNIYMPQCTSALPVNKGKSWKDQIKPFNFFYVGFQMIRNKKKSVKPLSPYSKDSQAIVHEPFIDYETGKTKQGLPHFKPLSKTILQYSDHKEFKFDGDEDLLTRKQVNADWIIHIGKEADKIEDEPLKGGNVQVFRNKEKERLRINSMRQCDAERMGLLGLRDGG